MIICLDLWRYGDISFNFFFLFGDELVNGVGGLMDGDFGDLENYGVIMVKVWWCLERGGGRGGGNYMALIQRLNQESDKEWERHQRRGDRQGEVTLKSLKAELRGLIVCT